MKNRNLSQHLNIYKPQITSMLSIFHRISGTLLSISFILFAFIFFVESFFSVYYVSYFIFFKCTLITSWFFISFTKFLGAILFFHLYNGLRHLSWDYCFGLEQNNIKTTGSVVLVISLISLCLILL